MEHYIAAYAISVRNALENEKRFFELNSIGTFDLFTITKDYLQQESIQKYSHSPDDKTTFAAGILCLDTTKRSIYGSTTYGKFGIQSTGIDTVNNSISYERDPKTADTMPHFYFFYIPEQSPYAILLVQRIGNSGIYSRLIEHYKAFIRDKVNSAVATTELLKPKAAIQSLSQQSSQCVTYKSLKLPKDISDTITADGILNLNEEDYTVEITFKPKRGKTLNLMPAWASSQTSSALLLESDNKKTKVLDKKIHIEINGKKRVVSMNDPTDIETYFAINESVEVENGHPTKESLLKYCEELSKDLHSELLP